MNRTKIPWCDYTWNPVKLDEPLHRRKPSKIFVCSMGDLFHEDVPDEFVFEVFKIMSKCRQHIFLLLTKRTKHMKEFVENCQLRSNNTFLRWPLPNVWLGVTVEDDKNYSRVDDLLNTPAAKHFISFEPLLGLIVPHTNFYGIDWVIVGGETGPGARECREEWIQSVYDQCQAAGTAFFFKQRGKQWVSRCEGIHCPSCMEASADDHCEIDWETRREWPE